MAKIDIKKLDGYKEGMTAEERLALYEKYELPEPDYTGYVSKDVFDKASSDLAEAKRRLKERMSEEEQKEAERAAAHQALIDEVESLKKEKTLSSLVANYVSLGYDSELAAKAAEAKVSGNTAGEFEALKQFLSTKEQAIIKQALEGTPRPPAGAPDPKTDKERQEINALRAAAGLHTL